MEKIKLSFEYFGEKATVQCMKEFGELERPSLKNISYSINKIAVDYAIQAGEVGDVQNDLYFLRNLAEFFECLEERIG